MTDPLVFTADTNAGEQTDARRTDVERTATGGFTRVVVGLDFSPESLHALELARTHFPGARRLLLHVTDTRVGTAPDLGGGVIPTGLDPALLGTLEHADGERLARLAQEGEETELLVGDPVTGILEGAERWGAELIVVGTHSRGVIEHFFVGSSAEKLVARSPVPVLTVRLPRGHR